MLKLSAEAFNEVRAWVYRNARQLELALWQYEFEGGSREAVLDAMAIYQNEDGGFGSAMEPDSWNPASTPYTTTFAMLFLKKIGFADANHPIVSGILRYLDSGAYFSDNGWEWSIPSNNDYAHAPWWHFEGADSTTEFGLSARIASFVLEVSEKDSSVYNRAIDAARKVIERLRVSTECDASGGNVKGTCALLETLHKLDLLDELDAKFLPEAVQKMFKDAIVADSSKWEEYGGRPLDYIEAPDSIYYKEFESAVQEELDYLVNSRHCGGVWGITWSWYGNDEKYPKQFAISENWWKSFRAIEIMGYLRSYGRLESQN